MRRRWDGLRRGMPLLRALLRRPWVAISLPAALAFGLAVAASLASGRPVPRVHDEFSHLLAADTFARGRMTNPAHPMGDHFETMHVLQRPTYQSMYPPAPALMLAVGEVLGDPLYGVWIGIALMAAALAWMLRGWLPPAWAFAGALLAVAQVVTLGREYAGGVVGYWSQSYWGGAVAAMGGALVYGALPRLIRAPRPRDAVWMGLGLAVLANSRPGEGWAASLPALAVLVASWVRRRGLERAALTRRAAIPLAVVLASAGLLTARYQQRVTGHAWKPPFIEHHEQYCVFPVMLWQSPREAPVWRHEELRVLHGEWEPGLYTRHFPWLRGLAWTARKAGLLWAFFLGPLLTLPLLWMPAAWRERGVRTAAAATALTLAFVLLCVRAAPHYAAPAAAPLFLLVTAGLRRAWHWNPRGARAGAWLAAATMAAAWIVALAAVPMPGRGNTTPSRHMLLRPAIEAQIAAAGGRHLVLVRYGPHHTVHNEWVFNGADPDGQVVVWARAMGPAEDAVMKSYYSDRTVWRVRIDDDALPPSVERE